MLHSTNHQPHPPNPLTTPDARLECHCVPRRGDIEWQVVAAHETGLSNGQYSDINDYLRSANALLGNRGLASVTCPAFPSPPNH